MQDAQHEYVKTRERRETIESFLSLSIVTLLVLRQACQLMGGTSAVLVSQPDAHVVGEEISCDKCEAIFDDASTNVNPDKSRSKTSTLVSLHHQVFELRLSAIRGRRPCRKIVAEPLLAHRWSRKEVGPETSLGAELAVSATSASLKITMRSSQ